VQLKQNTPDHFKAPSELAIHFFQTAQIASSRRTRRRHIDNKFLRRKTARYQDAHAGHIVAFIESSEPTRLKEYVPADMRRSEF
jgi:hypothetical protein